MSATIARVLAVAAIVVTLGAVAAPAASAAPDHRNIGNGSLNICFVVPLPGSANIAWCL